MVALTDLTALFIPADTFLKFVSDNPRVSQQVMRGLAERIQDLGVRVESITNAEQKLARAVIDIVHSGLFTSTDAGLELTGFNQRDLASLAGISRESVSAILKPLKAKGAVAVGRQRITVHDLGHFEALAQRVDHALAP